MEMEKHISLVLELIETIPDRYRDSSFPLLLQHSLTKDRLSTPRQSTNTRIYTSLKAEPKKDLN